MWKMEQSHEARVGTSKKSWLVKLACAYLQGYIVRDWILQKSNYPKKAL